MHFEYEITADEFAASQLLYHRLNRRAHGRRLKLRQNPVIWIIVGIFFIIVAWSGGSLTWAPILLTATAIWWIYAGFVNLFPTRYFRKLHRGAELWGKRFTAEVNQDGLEIVAELCTWRVPWKGVKLKGENDQVFIIYSANTIFIFGKRYLNNEQQEEFRRLSGIGSPK